MLYTIYQGLRITLLMGAFGTALGAWIKVLGAAPDLFYVALIGQTITAMSQVGFLFWFLVFFSMREFPYNEID